MAGHADHVFGQRVKGPLIEAVTRTCERDALGMLREHNSKMAVEDFGMPLNLMLDCSAMLVNSEEEGIELLATMLRHGPASSRQGTFDSWLQARVLDYNARKVAG